MLLFVIPLAFTVYTPAPPSVKAPAVLLKVIEPTVRLLPSCGALDALPAKMRISPATGACAGVQFPAVLTKPVPEAPVHVSVAAARRNSLQMSNTQHADNRE